jgi:raffinose/stachyose/melibiose transport system permease protein
MSIKEKTDYKFIHLFLVLFAFIQIFPFIWLVNFSLKTNAEILTKSSFSLPEKPVFLNYPNAWKTGGIGRYFFSSFFVTVLTVVFVTVFGGMLSYSVTRMKWKLSGVAFLFVMLGMMIPIHASLIPLFIVLRKLRLLSTHFGLVLAYTASCLPVAVFVFSNFLRSTPYELEAAAFIDGSGVLRTFFVIIFPTLAPAIATVAISVVLSSWNEFIMASTFLQDPSIYTLPVGLTAFKSRYATDWGPLGAAIVISCLPIITFYFIFSERIEKGFFAGAILK